MKPGLLVQAWGVLVLGLLVRALAGGLLGGRGPAGVELVPHRVDLNRAGVAELTVLPGVGPARAEAILVERIRRGWFRDLADLDRVDGLGPAFRAACAGVVEFAVPAHPEPR